jgi:hypothetical protein
MKTYVLLAILAAGGIASCSFSPTPPPKDAVLTIDPPKSLGVGQQGPVIPDFPWNVPVGGKCVHSKSQTTEGKPIDGTCPAG